MKSWFAIPMYVPYFHDNYLDKNHRHIYLKNWNSKRATYSKGEKSLKATLDYLLEETWKRRRYKKATLQKRNSEKWFSSNAGLFKYVRLDFCLHMTDYSTLKQYLQNGNLGEVFE